MNIASLAKDCLKASKGNWDRAVRRFRKKLEADAALMAEFIEPLLDAAIREAIRKATRGQRRAIVAGHDDPSGLASVAKQHVADFLVYSLSSGLALGDATRPKLLDEAKMHDQFARANGHRATWFTQIAAGIDNDEKRVSDVFSSRALQEMWEAAK